MPHKTGSNSQQRHLKKQSKFSQEIRNAECGVRNKKNTAHYQWAPDSEFRTPHSSVSLCMIVKNEEKTLSRCLESAKFFVNEIVIVDTGSTDKTVEVAESYGAKILHKAWTGN